MKAKDILKLEEKNGSFTHAYLFVGNEDETLELTNYIISLKNILPEDISRLSPEMNETGKKSEIKVDDVREALHEAHLSPQGKFRLLIIKNCEKLNSSSGNILLKILEEPPAHLMIVLTAKARSILPTIKSRCRVVNVNGGHKENVIRINFKDFLGLSFFEASKQFEIMAKDNKVDDFLDNLVAYLEDELLNKKSQSIVSSIKNALRTKKEISENANVRLALECLFLNLKKELYV